MTKLMFVSAGILCENPAEGPLRDRMIRAYATNTYASRLLLSPS